jgi:transposase-like protein
VYRAMDKAGTTMNSRLRSCRDKTVALRHFEESIALKGEPEKVTIDKNRTNRAGLEAINCRMRSSHPDSADELLEQYLRTKTQPDRATYPPQDRAV